METNIQTNIKKSIREFLIDEVLPKSGTENLYQFWKAYPELKYSFMGLDKSFDLTSFIGRVKLFILRLNFLFDLDFILVPARDKRDAPHLVQRSFKWIQQRCDESDYVVHSKDGFILDNSGPAERSYFWELDQ